jgi:hypothetical protein
MLLITKMRVHRKFAVNPHFIFEATPHNMVIR